MKSPPEEKSVEISTMQTMKSRGIATPAEIASEIDWNVKSVKLTARNTCTVGGSNVQTKWFALKLIDISNQASILQMAKAWLSPKVPKLSCINTNICRVASMIFMVTRVQAAAKTNGVVPGSHAEAGTAQRVPPLVTRIGAQMQRCVPTLMLPM